MKIALIVASVGLSAVANICLRYAMRNVEFELSLAWLLRTFTTPAFIAGFACQALGFIAWLAVLARVQVSIAYPFQALGYLFASMLAWMLLGENISPLNAFGLALVCCGVLVLAFAARG